MFQSYGAIEGGEGGFWIKKTFIGQYQYFSTLCKTSLITWLLDILVSFFSQSLAHSDLDQDPLGPFLSQCSPSQIGHDNIFLYINI